eukprot:TRINITY_DN8673_c0_g1_i1.p1 TRINITY_DN8673_c0_g1~~TRINITY_DN8673_c0_g1_i1.p1  ORF type:complete len:228 (+),score=51.05 TRINITY_DN8673_c0_g1_i1:33-686(+)
MPLDWVEILAELSRPLPLFLFLSSTILVFLCLVLYWRKTLAKQLVEKKFKILNLVRAKDWKTSLPDLSSLSLSDIEDIKDYDRSLLHCASHHGNAEAVKFLLEKGMDVNALDLSKHTPVGFAAAANSLECVKELVSAGANVNLIDVHGHGPLYAAAVRGHVEVVKFLVEVAKVDVNQKEISTNFTVLQLVDGTKFPEMVKYLRSLPEFSGGHGDGGC